jgi:hypothetical protein
MPQGEILKTTGRWHKKSGRTEQSGYQFKNTDTRLQKLSNVFIPVGQEKSIEPVRARR